MHTSEEINEVKSLLNKKFNKDFKVEEDVLSSLIITYDGKKPENSEDIERYLESLGYFAFDLYELSCYSPRVAFILKYADTSFIINSDDDELLLKKFMGLEEASLDVVSLKYHELTGAEVYDRRIDKDHQFTNVNAQRDEDFWNEENING